MAVARDARTATASSSAVSQDDLIPEEYQRYFRTLVLQTQSRDATAFSMFMHIRIVSEICKKLNIPCIHGVRISNRHLVGNQLVSVSDIVDKLGHRKPGTFNNHRGYVHIARLCLDHLETYGHDLSEDRFMKQVKQLLETPLEKAASELTPTRYGNMKDFNSYIKAIARRHGIKRKQADGKEGISSESE